MNWLRKHLKIGPYGLAALAIIIGAATLRIIIIAQGWPSTNSDEGTMGLMAMHIAYNGALPIYLYGQSYMGVIEAYLAAIPFALFGPSSFGLRLGLVFLYSLFLFSMYFLTRLLYSRTLAIVVLALLSLGSIEMLTRQLKAVGGDVETMLFASCILLLASWLTLTFDPASDLQSRRSRSLIYGCLGLIIGLALWSHMLILPFVVVVLALHFLFCRRELKTRPYLFPLIIGCIVGTLPLLIYNVQNPAQNSLFTLLALHFTGGTPASLRLGYSPLLGILGTLFISLPMATGATPMCPASSAPGQWVHSLACMPYQAIWGLGYAFLLALGLWLGLRALRAARRAYASSQALADRKALTLAAVRLAPLMCVILTLCAYLLSPAPAVVPITSARYLVGLLVATPCLLAPLFYGFQTGRSFSVSLARLTRVMRYAILLFIACVYLFGIISVFQQLPSIQSGNQQEQRLIDDLLRHHITHIYSDYWTCDRIIFDSGEHIICSVVNDSLNSGQNRYPPYQAIVQRDPKASYAFIVASPPDHAFTQRLLGTGSPYHMLTFEGYHIYQPNQP